MNFKWSLIVLLRKMLSRLWGKMYLLSWCSSRRSTRLSQEARSAEGVGFGGIFSQHAQGPGFIFKQKTKQKTSKNNFQEEEWELSWLWLDYGWTGVSRVATWCKSAPDGYALFAVQVRCDNKSIHWIFIAQLNSQTWKQTKWLLLGEWILNCRFLMFPGMGYNEVGIIYCKEGLAPCWTPCCHTLWRSAPVQGEGSTDHKVDHWLLWNLLQVSKWVLHIKPISMNVSLIRTWCKGVLIKTELRLLSAPRSAKKDPTVHIKMSTQPHPVIDLICDSMGPEPMNLRKCTILTKSEMKTTWIVLYAAAEVDEGKSLWLL